MELLKVPYGLSVDDTLVAAASASKDSAYRCPCCSAELVLKAGAVNVAHFAHPTNANCSSEAIIHITAKHLIQSVMNDNANGEGSITLEVTCANCSALVPKQLPYQTFTGAEVEVKVDQYICDVVGYKKDGSMFAVEIFNTHKVDTDKSVNLPVYWIELKAENVIDNPQKWLAVQSRLKDCYCDECKAKFKRTIAAADKYGIDRSLYSVIKNPDVATYIADTETCFRCKNVIPVFWWRGVPFCEVEPPLPRPKTIKYKHSQKYGGEYWANTCPCCSSLQGDNFLFLFDNAPFAGLPMANQSPQPQAGVSVRSGSGAMSSFLNMLSRNGLGSRRYR